MRILLHGGKIVFECVYVRMYVCLYISIHSFHKHVFSVYYEPYNILDFRDTKVNKTDRKPALEEFAV